ncbi:hypothetical protein OIU78_012893 [Salix suchowensis]|nr:hypothetical protein OIU78_012893 [Salix suchowensis]
MGNHTESVEPHEFTEALPGENDSKVLLPHQQLLKLTNKLKLKLKKAMPQHCFQPNHARQKKNVNFLMLDLKNGLALYCSHTNCLRKQVAVNLLKITNKLKLKLKKAGMLNRSHTRNSRKQITVNQWKLTNKPKRKLNALPLYTTLLLQRQLLKQENDDELVEVHKQTEAHAEKCSRRILLPHEFFQKSNMVTG